MIDDEEARENFMKDICTFLRKFSRIPFGVTPKVILIAWERFGKIKDALTDEQYQQEDIQELMSKLLEDVRNISEELSEYINCPSWNRPTIFFDDDDEYTIIYSKPKAITPDLPIEEPDNSLSMGDEHLSTISETESDELIKSSVENLVPTPSEFEGISKDTCDMPVGEDSSTFDALSDHSEILSDSNNDGTSSDDNDFEDIEYVDASPPDSELVSLEEVNDVDQEEKEFDLEDILQIQDVILREKLLNINRLIANIESLNDNLIPDHVFKSPSSFPIPVTDSDSFFEESDTSLSHLDNSLPETFSNHTEETRSGSTTTHANNSLPEGRGFETQEGYNPIHATSAATLAHTWRTQTGPRPGPIQTRSRHRPKTRPNLAHDPPVDWRSTTVDRWSGGGPAVVRRWSAAVDRRWPPLTATVDRWWSGDGAGTVITPRGTTQVVTRGILMIGVRGTVQVYEVVSTRNDPEAHVAASHWWIQLAVT
ncbi:hypothetical protein Tco_0272725, partial [Tanacetum coccineum]